MYDQLATEFFRATGIVASLIDSPEIRVKKKELMKRFERYVAYKARFEKAAVQFSEKTRSDELLGLADKTRQAKELYQKAYITFANEAKGKS